MDINISLDGQQITFCTPPHIIFILVSTVINYRTHITTFHLHVVFKLKNFELFSYDVTSQKPFENILQRVYFTFNITSTKRFNTNLVFHINR